MYWLCSGAWQCLEISVSLLQERGRYISLSLSVQTRINVSKFYFVACTWTVELLSFSRNTTFTSIMSVPINTLKLSIVVQGHFSYPILSCWQSPDFHCSSWSYLSASTHHWDQSPSGRFLRCLKVNWISSIDVWKILIWSWSVVPIQGILSSPDIEFRSFGAGDPKGNFVTVIRLSKPSRKKIKNDFICSTFHFVRTRMNTMS